MNVNKGNQELLVDVMEKLLKVNGELKKVQDQEDGGNNEEYENKLLQIR